MKNSYSILEATCDYCIEGKITLYLSEGETILEGEKYLQNQGWMISNEKDVCPICRFKFNL